MAMINDLLSLSIIPLSLFFMNMTAGWPTWSPGRGLCSPPGWRGCSGRRCCRWGPGAGGRSSRPWSLRLSHMVRTQARPVDTVMAWSEISQAGVASETGSVPGISYVLCAGKAAAGPAITAHYNLALSALFPGYMGQHVNKSVQTARETLGWV